MGSAARWAGYSELGERRRNRPNEPVVLGPRDPAQASEGHVPPFRMNQVPLPLLPVGHSNPILLRFQSPETLKRPREEQSQAFVY